MKLIYLAFLVVAVLTAFPVSAFGQNGAAGHWEGVMRRGLSTLTIAIDLDTGRPTRGFFTAGDLGAMDIPIANIGLDGSASWDLIGDRSTVRFNGLRDGDSIRGTTIENDIAGTFQLHRVSTSIEKPYTVTEVHFISGGITLAGSILSPKSQGKHRGVVFLHGSGPEGRWASRFTADYLARHGIVALIYDKRGVGDSTGDWRTSTLEDLAADGRAAVHLLSQRSDVRRDGIGLFGHSQGGFIAPYVALNNPEVHWIINADGNVGPQYKQDLFRVETTLKSSYSGVDLRDAVALYREFVDVARNSLPHDQLNSDKDRFGKAPWFGDLGLPDDQSWIWAWYARVGNDDNSTAWRTIKAPVMLLYGGNDMVVPPQESIDAISRLLRAGHNPRVTVQVLAGADHSLRLAPDDPHGWPHYAAGYPALLSRWISKQ